MATNSQETATRGRWDTTQLRDVTNRPLGSERTLDEPGDPTSSKDYVKITLEPKLVNAFDRVWTKGGTPFLEFVYSNLTPEQSRQRAALLLNNRDLLRNVQGLSPEDQTRFIDKVDQVRQSWLIRLSHVHLSSFLQRRTRPPTREL